MSLSDGSVDQVTLVFREQADGRKVARLPTGKIVLVGLDYVDRVADGERWLVELDHRDTFAIGIPIERLEVRARVLGELPAAVREPALAAPAPEPEAPEAEPEPPATPAQAPPARVRAPDPDAARPEAVVGAGERVALFIDGANTDAACRHAGYFLDYAASLAFCRGPGLVYAGFYYVADFTHTDGLQIRFLDHLSHHGFVVRKKPVKRIVDENGQESFKANVDSEIVVDMLNTAPNYDVAFLLSGDSDFERVVDILRSRGKRVYAVSSRGNLSRELAYVVDKPVFYLEDHRASLERAVHAPDAGPAAS